MRVETGGDEDQLRIKCPYEWLKDLVPNPPKCFVPRSSWQRYIYYAPPCQGRILVPTRARIDAPLMGGQVGRALISEKRRLRAVPVMGVVVHDGDAACSPLKRIPGSDRNIIEEAESHRASRLRVVTGRAHDGKRIEDFAGQNRPHTPQGRAGCL
jgi:hypothetical protein